MLYRCWARCKPVLAGITGLCLVLAGPLWASGELFRLLTYGDTVQAIIEKLKNDQAVYVTRRPPFQEAGYYLNVGDVSFQVQPKLEQGVLHSVQMLSAVEITETNYFTEIPKVKTAMDAYLNNLYGSSVLIQNALLPHPKALAKSVKPEILETWHGENVIIEEGVVKQGAYYHLSVSLQYDATVSHQAELDRQQEYAKYMQKKARQKQLVEKLGTIFNK